MFKITDETLLSAIMGTVLGSLVTSAIVTSYLEPKTVLHHKAQKLIAECESELQRNKNCEIVLSTKVKDK